MKKGKINRLFIGLFANCFITTLFLMTACSYEAAAKESQAPKVIVKTAEGKDVTLELSKLEVSIKIIGNIAVTTMDMSFSNSFPSGNRLYEGTLLFPLSDGQSINRLAMEMNGHLREGVIVEKEKGRVVFEEIERKQVDPALLEMTSSNNYKLRVYPIMPKESKRIVIAYEEILSTNESALYYNLPLNYGGIIPEISITADVFGSYSMPKFNEKSIDADEFEKDGGSFTTAFSEDNFRAEQAFSFIIPHPENKKEVITEEIDGVNYFQVTRSIDKGNEIEFNPNKLTIFWDCSFTGESRNIEKEIEFLQNYFNEIKNCRIELVTFNFKIKSKKEFNISGGNIEALLSEIKKVNYDGGSDFSCVSNYQTNSNAVLLFSDGISSIGSAKLIETKAPLYSINSNLKANVPYLKQLSLSSGGVFINLAFEETEQAVYKIRYKQMRLISVSHNSDIKELYPFATSDLSNDLSLSGILSGAETQITLNIGYGNEITKRETITISTDDKIESGLLARLWAKKKLDYLNQDSKKNKAEMLELGTKYQIITPNTSLIILENAWDYARYNITPPKDDEKLYADYEKINKNKTTKPVSNETNYAEGIVQQFKERIKWYEKEHKAKAKKSADTNTRNIARNSAAGEVRAMYAPREERFETLSTLAGSLVESDVQVMACISDVDKGEERNNIAASSSEIKLSAYKSDAAYYAELEKAPNIFEKYREYKKDNKMSVGFYVDVSEILSAKNMKADAAEIITNIAELSDENQEYLRLVAYKLQYLGELDLAIKLFEYIKEIRGEEPQSYRDLALAYEEKGNYQAACDLLYECAFKKWDGRFNNVSLTALTEMNIIISNHKDKVNISNYNKEVIYPMPLDVRVVLKWDLDNTDIDLWVTAPNGEKCYYSNPHISIGGLFPEDFTGGYGPEEFLLKKAIKGSYKVQANYFGSRAVKMSGGVTLFLELYTNYGKPNQTKKTIVQRVKNDKDVVDIADFEFK